MTRPMIRRTHLPRGDGRTYCGRRANLEPGSYYRRGFVPVIDLRRQLIDDATCKACQRSDDRRAIQGNKEATP